jgi:hypothetical protein
MTDWASAYAHVLAETLEGMAFLCITADTPDVLANIAKPHFWFSGLVCMGFQNGRRIELTWHANRQCLVLGQESDWRPFSLDRINMSWEQPYELGAAVGSARQVFAQSGPPLRGGDRVRRPGLRSRLVAARHDFIGPETTISLWVCTSHAPGGQVGEGDDLYVGFAPPANAGELTLSMSIGQA